MHPRANLLASPDSCNPLLTLVFGFFAPWLLCIGRRPPQPRIPQMHRFSTMPKTSPHPCTKWSRQPLVAISRGRLEGTSRIPRCLSRWLSSQGAAVSGK